MAVKECLTAFSTFSQDSFVYLRQTRQCCLVCLPDSCLNVTMECTLKLKYSFSLLAYQDILEIPAGATNVRIRENSNSRNYLGKIIDT